MSHWYALDGTPTYTIKGANGKERDTTLRDAKKLKLVPSVTTVMSVQDKPGLLIWKMTQLLDAAMANPYHPLVGDEDKWRAQVVKQANEITKKAAEYGTLIHDNIEQCIKEDFISCKKGIIEVIEPVICFLKDNFPGFEFTAEDSFSHPLGFGGKIDLYGVKNKGQKNERRMVLDFKTKNKDSDDMAKLKAYDDHHLQTAAYVKGLEDTKDFGSKLDYSKWERYNLFIGYEVVKTGYFRPTGMKLTESKDFEREWGMFNKLLEFWQLKNNYKP
jgi:hypothetical protein